MKSKTWNFLNFNLVSGFVRNGFIAYAGYRTVKSYSERRLDEINARREKLKNDLDETHRQVEEQIRLTNWVLEQVHHDQSYNTAECATYDTNPVRINHFQ